MQCYCANKPKIVRLSTSLYVPVASIFNLYVGRIQSIFVKLR